ncbi:SEL1-like repeat protein [Methylocapsa sp. S129]|uniref:SEL1-like repeat protein n=1 Tax=Methylocapsa sp. S129 TaxID=1641869 RepID=UPI00131DBE79|nr:SEL1-like repeat protein [Methylocapsa sp. S129]
MNRAAAWSVRGVGRETRDAAQEAARRAGMSLGEWLDEVIADQAADQGVDPGDFDEDEKLDAIGDRLSGLSSRDEARAGRLRRDGADERDDFRLRVRARPAPLDESGRADELLDAAISRFESRAAKSDARTARALDSVASLMERSQDGRRDERETLKAVVGRLESLEERIVRQQTERDALVKRPAVQAEPRVDRARDLDERMSELSQRIGTSDKGRGAPRARPRIDIDDAVSQIARRRQELDARSAGGAPEPPKRGWRNFGIEAPAAKGGADENAIRENGAQERAAQDLSAAGSLQIEIRKLSQRLDELRREQSEKREAPAANIEALRAELAAMSRSLADLAPRNAVVALEGAIRDLSQRVAVSRENGARDNLLAPVEGLVAGLRESLRTHDPREAVAALQREIGSIGAKVDGIADASIDPRAFERIRQQVEETRTLLSALAQRPMPVDRLERQIGELADRVDRMSTSLTPQHESAEVVASLAEARAQVERSTPASALNSIERRLEQIASRMDQALERPSAAPAFNPGALEDLSRRIDGVRQSIETHYASPPSAPLDTSLLERAMREISAKLDRPIAAAIDPNAFESMIQDLGARIDRRASPVIDTAPLEQVLRKLGERPAALDTRPLEGLMREISAKLDRPTPAAIDAGAFESMIHDLGARIDRRPDPVIDTGLLEQTLRSLHDKIDRGPSSQQAVDRIDQAVEALSAQIASKGGASDTGALERMVAELLAQLDETRRALRDASSAPSANAVGADDAFIRGLADLRAEQSNSDRRIQTTLGGVHDMLETLVDRIGQIEEDVARGGQAPQGSSNAPPPAASYGAASPAPASAALNAMDATIREAPVFAPARPTSEPRADKGPDPRAPQLPPATPMRSIDGSEFLIEPGSGAPLRAFENDAIANANPKSAVNAHIAAARRAAQAALAETASNVAKGGARPSPDSAGAVGGIEQAKTFFAARRRPILLGVALVALLTIAFVELGVMRQPSTQKSETESIATPKLASAEPSKDASAPASPAKIDARALDTTPVGSISAAPAASGPTAKFLSPAPADLVASIPAAAPQALHDAAAAGDPAAQFELASRLADGRNMTRDPRAAFLWFDRAAAQGLAPAQYRLGSLYEKGTGVGRDAPLAMAWYKKAAEAGNARAMHNLAVLIAEGGGSIKPDYSEAANWFQKAAQLGVKDSQYNLAILYARGMGLAQDINQSWLWFSLAAQQGDLDAAKKRDEVAAKMDAKALAADAVALANFHTTPPNPAANDVPVPPGGWDLGKIGAPPTPPQATNSASHASHAAATPL